ncbi:MAG: ABC transporter ATP-binding protein [Parvibaculaceae bacterium]
MTQLLDARDINVSFGGLKVIRDVSLTVRKGEILGLIGPNGAGKTTFVNVLSGFQMPNSGSVSLNSDMITAWAPERRARAGLTRTFQAVRLFKDLSVLDNVQVGALAMGQSRAAAERNARAVLEETGLAGQAAQIADTLPYGLERRVGIARALVMNPEFVMMDEPAAGLNEAEADELMALIRRIRDNHGCGVLLVEHNMQLVYNLCERVQVLLSGRTLVQGTPAEVWAHDEVHRAYLGQSAR